MSEFLMRPRREHDYQQANYQPATLDDALTYSDWIFAESDRVRRAAGQIVLDVLTTHWETSRWPVPEAIMNLTIDISPLKNCDDISKANWREDGF